jgi:hypothetical protein
MRYHNHHDKSDGQLGFDLVQDWISIGIGFVFYVIFFPIVYPLRQLGKRRRAELDANPIYTQPHTLEILAQARKRK